MQIVVAKLGDRDKGFIPSKKMFEQFSVALTQVMKDEGKSILATHAFVSFQTVDVPDGAKVVVSGDIEGIQDDSETVSVDTYLAEVEAHLKTMKNADKLVQVVRAYQRQSRPWWKRLLGLKG